MINEVIEVYEKLKAEKPRIHMIPNEVSAAFCADLLAAIGAKPVMAIEPKEVAIITEHAKCLVVNMGQLTDRKYKAIQESVKVACTKGIPVVLDPVGVGASSYRLECVNEILDMSWKGLIKLNYSEYEAVTGQKLTYSGVDSDPNSISQKVISFHRFGEGKACCLTGREDWIGERKWEVMVKHTPSRLPQIVGSGCSLGALCGAIRAVEEKSVLACSVASYLMSIAALQAEEKAIGYMDYKMYLIDALYGIKIDALKKYADLLIERRKA